ncbi:MAG: hypothetical protein AAB932_01590, partial [Patescibacteria group bacterium]
AQYISALYRYLLGIVLLVAAVMVVYGGCKYILGQTAGSIQGGKEIITDAIIGLVLVLGAVVILRTVNPSTTDLKALRIAVIEPDPLARLFRTGDTADLKSYEKIAKGEQPPALPGCPSDVTRPTNPKGINSWDRMQAACGSDLKTVIQRWLEEGLNGAAYIRGGVGGGKDLKLYPPQTGFMLMQLFQNTPSVNSFNHLSEDTLSACGIDPDDYVYDGDEGKLPTKELRDANSQLNKSNGRTKTPCYAKLERDYMARVVNPIKCNNMLGTDCGLFVAQISKCGGRPLPILAANGDVQRRIAAEMNQTGNQKPNVNDAGKINIYQYTGSEEKNVEFAGIKKFYLKKNAFLSKAACTALGSDCKTATSYSGGVSFDGAQGFLALSSGRIGFGAGIGFICGGIGHFVMYTGGAGLPFEVIESGGKGSAPRKDKSIVSFPDQKRPYKFGIQTTARLADYLAGAGCTSGYIFYIN